MEFSLPIGIIYNPFRLFVWLIIAKVTWRRFRFVVNPATHGTTNILGTIELCNITVKLTGLPYDFLQCNIPGQSILAKEFMSTIIHAVIKIFVNR